VPNARVEHERVKRLKERSGLSATYQPLRLSSGANPARRQLAVSQGGSENHAIAAAIAQAKT
jgi:hypothetical protein